MIVIPDVIEIEQEPDVENVNKQYVWGIENRAAHAIRRSHAAHQPLFMADGPNDLPANALMRSHEANLRNDNLVKAHVQRSSSILGKRARDGENHRDQVIEVNAPNTLPQDDENIAEVGSEAEYITKDDNGRDDEYNTE